MALDDQHRQVLRRRRSRGALRNSAAKSSVHISSCASSSSESSKKSPPAAGRARAASPSWSASRNAGDRLGALGAEVVHHALGRRALPEAEQDPLAAGAGGVQLTLPSASTVGVRSTSDSGSRIVDVGGRGERAHGVGAGQRGEHRRARRDHARGGRRRAASGRRVAGLSRGGGTGPANGTPAGQVDAPVDDLLLGEAGGRLGVRRGHRPRRAHRHVEPDAVALRGARARSGASARCSAVAQPSVVERDLGAAEARPWRSRRPRRRSPAGRTARPTTSGSSGAPRPAVEVPDGSAGGRSRQPAQREERDGEARLIAAASSRGAGPSGAPAGAGGEGRPAQRRALADAAARRVADAAREGGLQARELRVGQRGRVLLAVERAQAALDDVVGQSARRRRCAGRRSTGRAARQVAMSVTLLALDPARVDRVARAGWRAPSRRAAGGCGRPRCARASGRSASNAPVNAAGSPTSGRAPVQMTWLSWSPLARSSRARST